MPLKLTPLKTCRVSRIISPLNPEFQRILNNKCHEDNDIFENFNRVYTRCSKSVFHKNCERCAATGAPSPLCFSESKSVSETPSIEYNSRRSNVSCPIIIPCRGNYASNYVCIFSRYKILRISKRNEEQSESREITLIKIHVRLYWIESNFYEYAQQEKKRKQNDTFGAPRRERCSSAWKVVEDSSRIAVPTRGMKIDQRSGRREDRDDASISKVVEWFRAFLPLLPPFSLSSLPLSPSLSSRSNQRPGQFRFELFAIFFILFPVIYIHTYIYVRVWIEFPSRKRDSHERFPIFGP